MTNDLVTLDDLSGLPGSPFTEAEVDAAVASLRSALGWHVAPVRAETVTLDVNWPARWLSLPTRQLVSVEAVRDADTLEVVDADLYRTSRHVSSIRRCGYWPNGHEAVEVDMTHGYERCPPDLLPILAEIATGNRGGTSGAPKSVNAGIYSVQFGDVGPSSSGPLSTSATLARHSLYSGPVVA